MALSLLLAASPASISSISVLLAALTAVLGGSVVLSGRRRPAYLAFIALCANVFLWHLSSIARGSQAWRFLSVAALLPLPLTLLRYLRIWLSENRATAGRARPVPASLWLLLCGAEIGLFYAYSHRDNGLASLFPTVLQWVTLLGLFGSLGPILREYRRSVRGGGARVTQRRLLYLLGVGLLTVTATALDYLDLPTGYPYASHGPAVGTILTLVYLYFLQQTLFLDRLLDISELVAKVVVLSGLVLLLSAIWTVMALLRVEPRQVIALVAFVTLILFEPLRSRLEVQVQRWTAWERYELTQHLSELRYQLSNVIDPREAVRRVLLVFEETQRMTHAAVYLLDAEGAGYDLAGHFGSHPVERLDAAARRPLWQRLLRARRPLTLEALEQERRLTPGGDTAVLETLAVLTRVLGELHAGAVLGIFAVGNAYGQHPAAGESADEGDVLPEGLLGFLCVRDERVSDAYTLDELGLLAGVAAQLGITLQNTKLYERMKERDRLAALGEMAAGLAHEIRNPLGAIKGAAELLSPGADGLLPRSLRDEEAGDFLRIIVEETRRLNRVVSQFLDYARPYRGELQAVRVDEVVHKTLPLLPRTALTKDTGGDADAERKVVLELAPSLPAVRGDPEQLRQVFLNLALNALEAMAAAGSGERRLTISTGLRRGRASASGRGEGGQRGEPTPPVPQQVEVRFSDTGPGIPPGVQKNLFIPFFTTKDRGTGLGLSISQRIIENHGGHIEVRSRPGAGATFTVVLPQWAG